jgi:glyoxylase-like metal-dependent hydrolase (beta-lactamase superfamily II)
VHPRGVKHLIDPAALTKGSIDTLGELIVKYGEIEPVAPGRIIAAEDSMVIDMGSSKLRIVLSPGHAAHHLCVFESEEGVLFSGDAAGIFQNGLLRLTTPPPFRLKETLESLARLLELDPKIICYGHLGGYPDAKKHILEFKALLLRWYDYAQTRAKQGQSVTGVLDEFIQREPGLSTYFAALDRDARKRDYNQLTNSITGLMTANG